MKEVENEVDSVLVTTSTGTGTESDRNAIPQKKKKARRSHLIGYISRRRSFRKKQGTRKETRGDVNTNHEAIESASNESNDITDDSKVMSNAVEDLIIRTQRVRKTVQPYMHMVPQRVQKKKSDSADADEIDSKKYINPINLKQEQNQASKAIISKPPENSILNHFRSISPPRIKNRINYNEDLVDEAFMYEEMLMNKKQKTVKPNPVQQAKNKAIDDAVKMLGNEITLVPLSSKKNSSSINNNNSSCSSRSSNGSTKLIQANLSFEGVSIVRTSSKPNTSSIQISDIKSLCSKKTTRNEKSQQKTCEFCKKAVKDEKELAIHQLKHLSITAVKIDKVNVLSAHHRRVSVVVAIRVYGMQDLISIILSLSPPSRIARFT